MKEMSNRYVPSAFDPRRPIPKATSIDVVDALIEIATMLSNINRNLIAIEAAILGVDVPEMPPAQTHTTYPPYTYTYNATTNEPVPSPVFDCEPPDDA